MRPLVTILVLGAAACADDPTSEPDHAFELRMNATIPAGTEAEYCKFVEVPDAWAPSVM